MHQVQVKVDPGFLALPLFICVNMISFVTGVRRGVVIEQVKSAKAKVSVLLAGGNVDHPLFVVHAILVDRRAVPQQTRVAQTGVATNHQWLLSINHVTDYGRFVKN